MRVRGDVFWGWADPGYREVETPSCSSGFMRPMVRRCMRRLSTLARANR
jgi:hypothetical protein